MSEYIRINRNIVNHWLWQDAEHLKWWLDLILMAATEDREVMHDSHVFTLKRGQVIASLRDLQRRWKTTLKRARTFISKLESEKLIVRTFIDKHTTKIKICNYGTYKENTQVAQSRAQLTDCKSDDNSIPRAQPRAQSIEKPEKKAQENTQVAQSRAQLTDCKSDDNSIPRAQPRDTLEENTNPPRARVISYNIYNNNLEIETSSISLSETSSDEETTEIDFSKFINFWNKEIDTHKSVIPKIRAIQGKRIGGLKARCREYGKTAFVEAVRKLVRSDYMNGKNDHGWIATLDWLIKPSNFPKVLEGNYDNKPKQPHQPLSTDYGAEEQRQREEQLRKRKATATTYEQYARWKKEHPEEYRKQQEILAKGGKLSDDSS